MFPILKRAEVMGISNLVSRPFSALSTILTEYTSTPLMYVIFSAVISFPFVDKLKEYKGKNWRN